MLNFIIVSLLLIYLKSLFPNCWNFFTFFHHYLTGFLIFKYSSLNRPLPSSLYCLVFIPHTVLFLPPLHLCFQCSIPHKQSPVFFSSLPEVIITLSYNCIKFHLKDIWFQAFCSWLNLMKTCQIKHHPTCELLGHTIYSLTFLTLNQIPRFYQSAPQYWMCCF